MAWVDLRVVDVGTDHPPGILLPFDLGTIFSGLCTDVFSSKDRSADGIIDKGCIFCILAVLLGAVVGVGLENARRLGSSVFGMTFGKEPSWKICFAGAPRGTEDRPLIDVRGGIGGGFCTGVFDRACRFVPETPLTTNGLDLATV